MCKLYYSERNVYVFHFIQPGPKNKENESIYKQRGSKNIMHEPINKENKTACIPHGSEPIDHETKRTTHKSVHIFQKTELTKYRSGIARYGFKRIKNEPKHINH